MKIIKMAEFLQMPKNTLFHKYESVGNFGELQIKICSPSDGWGNDFVTQEICGFIDGAQNSTELINSFLDLEQNGESFSFDLESGGRDGYFEEEQLFAVYEKEDIEKLIEKLKRCIC